MSATTGHAGPATTAATAAAPVSGDRVDSPRSWLVVAGTVVATTTMFGIVYSFGSFFGAMADDFGAGKDSTAAVFSFTIFFLFVLGAVSGRIADRFGPRPLAVAAGLLLGSGLWATSLVDRMWIGYITYGAGVGIGVACAYVPLITLVSGWFDRQRATALGVASAGIGLGTIIGAPIARQLIDAFGWRETYRILAVVALVGLGIAALFAKRAPLAPAGPAAITVGELAAKRAFRLMYGSGALMGLSLFVPFVFLIRYAEEQGIAKTTAATLISVLGIGSVLGRLILGAIGARMGILRLYQLCFLVMCLSYLIWLAAGGTFAVLALFAFVLGVSYGGYVALSPAVAAHLFGLAGLGSTVGLLYTGSGFGALVGPPLAGRMIDATGTYFWAQAAAFAVALGSYVLLVLALRNPAAAASTPAPDEPAARLKPRVARPTS
ncbi:MAG: MFS transporter [Acidimicrobiia bacterium]|nr:MFS transporter [Acidimicrobiia bacterium]